MVGRSVQKVESPVSLSQDYSDRNRTICRGSSGRCMLLFRLFSTWRRDGHVVLAWRVLGSAAEGETTV